MTAADRWKALLGKRVLYSVRSPGHMGRDTIFEGTVDEVSPKGYVGIRGAGLGGNAVYWFEPQFLVECEVLG